MPLPNINAGAAGNPLDALLAGRAMWGNAGGMLYTQGGNGPDAFNVGSYAPDGSTPEDVLTTDPRYFMQSRTQGSEGGGGDTVYKLNSRTLQALNGRVQIRNTTIGGPGGVIDPSKVTYDPEFGLVTDPRNLNAVGETFLDKYGPWILAAPAIAGAGMAAAAGVGTGAGGAGAAGVTGSSALETGGFGTGVGAAGSGLPGAAAEGIGAGTSGSLSSGGFDANGNWTDLQPYDGSPTNLPTVDTSTLPTYNGGNSSLLQQLNSGRQYFNGARSVMNLLNGSQGGGQRSGGMGSTDLSSLLSSLFSGSGGGALGGILGLLAGGHQAFGGGIGTASGAQDVANHASALADPWGSSGSRAAFANMLTPAQFMSLTSQDPSAVLNNPAYKFDLAQGTNAINMGDAAQGTLRSGNRGYELQNYGQGLASKYGQQMFTNNMATLNALSGLAGVNAGSPTGSAQALMNGFDNASNIRNAGTNGLFSGGSSNPFLGGSAGGQSPIMSLLSQLFSGGGSGGFDMSSVDFGSLPGFNDTSGFNPGDFFSFDDGSSSLADATGAFF